MVKAWEGANPGIDNLFDDLDDAMLVENTDKVVEPPEKMAVEVEQKDAPPTRSVSFKKAARRTEAHKKGVRLSVQAVKVVPTKADEKKKKKERAIKPKVPHMVSEPSSSTKRTQESESAANPALGTPLTPPRVRKINAKPAVWADPHNSTDPKMHRNYIAYCTTCKEWLGDESDPDIRAKYVKHRRTARHTKLYKDAMSWDYTTPLNVPKPT
ncbi:hypothetical protein DFP72DRAFT_1073345 [Ephemerocybe angulata]|uniref:Uncharacterized protein n=1 Tax=Ephemerocybe angulata TaxID=980116 RepID=A0A8H6HLI1_9AGAR|nr:hypothetical protein DFP72DRAFT_1073345 [Tulosesus angulatus]